MLYRSLICIATLLTLVSCKNSASALKGGASCSAADIASLKQQIKTLESSNGGAPSLALGSKSDAIVASYSNGFQSESGKFRKVADQAPYPNWEQDLGGACATYGVSRAQTQCKNDSKCLSWWSIDTNSQQYINYRTEATRSCINDFKNYVNTRNTAVPTNTDNAEGTTPEKIPVSHMEEDAAKLTSLKKQLAACEQSANNTSNVSNTTADVAPDLLTEPEFQTKCESAGGKFVVHEHPYVCTCASGSPVDLASQKTCFTRAEARALCEKISGVQWDATSMTCVCDANKSIVGETIFQLKGSFGQKCADASSSSSSSNSSNSNSDISSNPNPPPRPNPSPVPTPTPTPTPTPISQSEIPTSAYSYELGGYVIAITENVGSSTYLYIYATKDLDSTSFVDGTGADYPCARRMLAQTGWPYICQAAVNSRYGQLSGISGKATAGGKTVQLQIPIVRH